MGKFVRLKGVKRNRRKGSPRNRAKRKKSVVERKRIKRMLARKNKLMYPPTVNNSINIKEETYNEIKRP